MAQFELIEFSNAEELAKAVASAWLDGIARARAAGGSFCVGLSGGRIAGQVFAEFNRQAKARQAALSHVHFFWADERCVPPTDAQSNYGVAREFLFDPLGITEDRIHRVQGELDPDKAGREAEAQLRRIAPGAPDGQPILDLVLLGMGEDGHVASLFPGERAEVVSDPAVYRAVIASKPPARRVTLSYGAVAAAHEAWVLVSGDGKEGALRESLRAEGRTPLARILRSRERTRILSTVPLNP
jgi:6-phosphogluconolactonase